MKNDNVIGIIGAGISGLSLAQFLIQDGFQVKIFEKSSQISPPGVGISLAPNSLCLLKNTSCYESIIQQGHPLHSFSLFKENKQLFTVNASASIKYFGAPWIGISRLNIQKSLSQGIENHLHFNKDIISIKNTDSQVELKFSDHTVEHVDLCIAADGINSKVRSLIFPEYQKRHSNQQAFISLTKNNHHLGINHADFFESNVKGSRFGYVRLKNNQIYFFCGFNSRRQIPDNFDSMIHYLKDYFSCLATPIQDIISDSDPDYFYKWQLYDLPYCTKWFYKRTLFIGDSIHATTPNLGQGASQGIISAFQLAQLLKDNYHRPSFQIFENKRKKTTQFVISNSRRYGEILYNQPFIIQTTIHLILKLLNLFPQSIKSRFFTLFLKKCI